MTLSSTDATPTEFRPKQKRSIARREAILVAGRKMLEQRGFEQISVAEITSSLGYSTGSFYSAFADKSAFFVALQNSISESLQADIACQFSREQMETLAPTARLDLFIDFVVSFFRCYRGHIKSALRHEPTLPEAWWPHKTAGKKLSDALVIDLDNAQADRLRFAVQMVYGTLVNAVLHNPGPLNLDDDAIACELKRAIHPYVQPLEE